MPTVDDVPLADTGDSVAMIETDSGAETRGLGRRIGSIFGGRAAAEPERNVPEVQQGVFVDYGAVVAVCGLNARDLGTKVETVSGYTLYDAGGDPAVARTHYLTGFADGCARQFTAAMALFGDVGTHEFVR